MFTGTSAAGHLAPPVVLLGAAGAGMQAAAKILADLGFDVVGLDKSTDRLDDIRPWSLSSLPNRISACIYSAAVPAGDPVMQAVRQLGECLSLADFVARVFADKRQICVAGTHGKTTTSAMLAWILDQCGYAVSWFFGADLLDGTKNGRFVAGDFAVIESCEFRQSFLSYQPSIALVTGIERDHFDCFVDIDEENRSYLQFLESAKHEVLINAQCARSQRLLTEASFVSGVQRVSQFGAELCPELKIKMPGHHNASNAVAALETACGLGIDRRAAMRALACFPGVVRRFQHRGSFQGAVFIDDYAHHPTAIAATIQAARQQYPSKKIVAIFEPHQINRTENLFVELRDSLSLADEVQLQPVFPARETASFAECCRSSGKLVKALNAAGGRAFLFANLDQTVARLEYAARPSDVILTMGAGRSHLIYDTLYRRLQRHFVA